MRQDGQAILNRADIYARGIIKENLTQTDAYRKAYPKSREWKPITISSRASTFAKDPRVVERLNHYKALIGRNFEYSIEKILNGLYNIAFNDPAEMYEPSGMIKNIHDIPKAHRQTLTGIKHEVVTKNYIDEDGNEASEPSMIIKEYRQESRKAALEKLLDYKIASLDEPEDYIDVEVDKKQLARELLLLVYEAEK